MAGRKSSSTSLAEGFLGNNTKGTCTESVKSNDYCYAGNVFRPVTLKDTPEFDISKDEQKHAIYTKAVNQLKDMKYLHQAIIVVNGTSSRLDGSMRKMLEIFETTFTPKIWKNAAIVFSNLPMSKKERTRRKLSKSDEKLAADYAKDIKRQYNVADDIQLDTFFIDASYDEEDEEEKNIFEKELEGLWKVINQKEKFDTTLAKNVLTQSITS